MIKMSNSQRNKYKINGLIMYAFQEANKYELLEHEYDQQIEMDMTHL